jgi:hypothetical protein
MTASRRTKDEPLLSLGMNDGLGRKFDFQTSANQRKTLERV